MGAGWHLYRNDILKFPKLQNIIHVSFVVVVVVIAGNISMEINN